LGILTTKTSAGEAWMDQTQIQYHTVYDTDYLPKLCNAPLNPLNKLRWSREPEYIPATNPDAAYVVAPVPANLPATLAAAGEVMRIRLQIPTTPATPCTNGCSRSGNEQMRYMSLSFVAGGTTMASMADFDFTKDSNGYATLIVGTGAAIPSWVTPANGYTYLDLTTVSGYQQLSLLALRHIIPSATFQCATKFVPYRTSVDTPLGSLLGDYTPMVDYPAAASLPHQTSPLTGILGCASFPLGEPDSLPQCGIFPAPVPSITSVVTECPAPGCSQFAAQSNPPITVVGTGFGVFPEGTPFTGTSKYLGIQDVTQGWYAGFTNDTCTISISGWDVGVIQFVTNTPNANGKCKMKSNDTVKVKVLNPQTLLPATYTVTAQ
jgi:hypothetical protein